MCARVCVCLCACAYLCGACVHECVSLCVSVSFFCSDDLLICVLRSLLIKSKTQQFVHNGRVVHIQLMSRNSQSSSVVLKSFIEVGESQARALELCLKEK